MRNEDDKKMEDLDWLAFCYIADELEPQERDAFELRLAEDQAARDAVVVAMEHAQLLNAAIEADQHSPSSLEHLDRPNQVSETRSGYHVTVTRFSRNMMGAAAALLLMAFGLMWFANSPTFETEYEAIAQAKPNAEDAEADMVAYAWVDALTELDEELSAIPYDDNGFTEVVFESDPEEFMNSSGDNDSWMLVALAEMESDDDMILPGEDENE